MDMEATQNLARVAAYLNPARFDALHSLMKTWKKEVLKELNFRNEAANVDRAHANLVGTEPVLVRGHLGVLARCTLLNAGCAW